VQGGRVSGGGSGKSGGGGNSKSTATASGQCAGDLMPALKHSVPFRELCRGRRT